MTRKKLVSGIRLFTKSPRFKRIWEVTQRPRRGKSPRLYSDADPLFRFALLWGTCDWNLGVFLT